MGIPHWTHKAGVKGRKWELITLWPCSVDSFDGGATDVPILGSMEIKSYILILFFIILPTWRFQNFLRIENRTIMSVYIFFLPTYRLEIMEIRKKFLFFWFFLFYIFDRPTVPKRLEKNLPSNESTEHGLKVYSCLDLSFLLIINHCLDYSAQSSVIIWVSRLDVIIWNHPYHPECLIQNGNLESNVLMSHA